MADNPRQEVELKFNTQGRGSMTLKMYDRITVDDVFKHLVERNVFRLVTGEDPGDEVNQLFKDALLKERFTAGQN